MIKTIAASAFLATSIAGGAAAQAAGSADPNYAYVGTWECPVGVFEIKQSTYQVPGGKPLRMSKVERSGNDFLLSFADGYRVSLFDVSATNLTWHSPISGDTFACLRIR